MNQHKIKFFQIDAFTQSAFNGNPAAVCPLDAWLDDDTLQKIAEENNLSETAFFVKENDGFSLRWFTPAVEVELCGHATLAAAWVIFNKLNYSQSSIKFYTLSGELIVSKAENDYLCMDFPAKQLEKIAINHQLLAALGIAEDDILSAWQADDILLEIKNEQIIEKLQPNFNELIQIPTRGVIVTARSNNFDFISRWFGPRVGVNEDPVTGSAHTCLTPFWANKLNSTLLTAQQGGKRKGQLKCELNEDHSRVYIYGQVCLVISGELLFSLSE